MNDQHITTIDQCEQGHFFAKLNDHPTRDGSPRCPYCMAIGLDKLRAEKGAYIQKVLDTIIKDCPRDGSDYELTVRRIWDKVRRAC